MRYAHAYHHGGDWQSEDFHEDAQRRYNAMTMRATRGGAITAPQWTQIAAELRRIAALDGQCPDRMAEAIRSAAHADLYARRGVPGGSDPRHGARP